MTDTSAPSSTLIRPVEPGADEDLLARWEHAAGAEPTPTTQPDATSPVGPSPAGGHRTLLRAVAGVVVVALMAVAAYFAYQDASAAPSTAPAQAAASSAAQHDAVALSTYTYTDLNAFFGGVKGFSTPGFSASFTKGAQSLVKILTQYKAVSTGKVASYGVKSFGGGKATILVMVDQSVSNSATKTPSAETEAFEFAMVDQGGRWLLNAETAVH